MSVGQQSALIVEAIVKDMLGRKGLGDEWDSLLREEQYAIEDEWRLLVRRILERT